MSSYRRTAPPSARADAVRRELAAAAAVARSYSARQPMQAAAARRPTPAPAPAPTDAILDDPRLDVDTLLLIAAQAKSCADLSNLARSSRALRELMGTENFWLELGRLRGYDLPDPAAVGMTSFELFFAACREFENERARLDARLETAWAIHDAERVVDAIADGADPAPYARADGNGSMLALDLPAWMLAPILRAYVGLDVRALRAFVALNYYEAIGTRYPAVDWAGTMPWLETPLGRALERGENADPDADQAGVRCRMARPVEWEHNKLMYNWQHTLKYLNNRVGMLVAGYPPPSRAAATGARCRRRRR